MLCDVNSFVLRPIQSLRDAPPRVDVDRFRVLFAAHRGVLLQQGDGGGVEVRKVSAKALQAVVVGFRVSGPCQRQ